MRKAAYLFSLFCIGAGAIHAQQAKTSPAPPPTPTGGPTPAQAILMLEKGVDSLDIVDPKSLTIVARVPAGGRPHEVVASDDGKTAYMANENVNNNVGGRFGFSGFTSHETISVVDLVHQEALDPIDLGALRATHGVDFADGKLYFTASGAHTVNRYNTATHKIDLIVGTGQNGPHMVGLTKGAKKIIAINSGSVCIVELVVTPPTGTGPGNRDEPLQSWRVTTIPVGAGSEGFDFSPDGKQLWTANARDQSFSVIDLDAEKLVETFHVDNTGGANRIKFTLDGKYILVSFLGRPEVLVLDPVTHKEVKRIPLKGSTEGLLMNPDGTKAYVTEDTIAFLAEIDLKTMTVSREMKTGIDPDGLAWVVRK